MGGGSQILEQSSVQGCHTRPLTWYFQPHASLSNRGRSFVVGFQLPACFDGSAEREEYAARWADAAGVGNPSGRCAHIGCNRPCCRNLFLRPATDRKVVCLGVTDTNAGVNASGPCSRRPQTFHLTSGFPIRPGHPARSAVFVFDPCPHRPLQRVDVLGARSIGGEQCGRLGDAPLARILDHERSVEPVGRIGEYPVEQPD